VLLDRVRKQLNDRGMLDVLRHGIELMGLRRPISLAQFKPAMVMNPDIVARYAANRLRIVRQVNERELHRPRAVPQRFAGRDRRVENRFHPKCRRRH
jgi:type I restriction enzyme, R subunit